MVRVINNSKEKQKIARFVLEALRQGDGSFVLTMGRGTVPRPTRPCTTESIIRFAGTSSTASGPPSPCAGKALRHPEGKRPRGVLRLDGNQRNGPLA